MTERSVGDPDRIADTEHGWSIRIPARASTGEAVTFERDARDGRHRVHAQTPDGSTVYVEVVSSPDRVSHVDAIAEQRTGLRERSPDAEIGAPETAELAGRPATGFTFEGRLGADRRRRRFVYVDTEARTVRIVYDPSSATNDAILATLVLDETPL